MSKDYKITHTFFIAGAQYHNMYDVLDKLEEGLELILTPEPNNQYDSNAVKIEYVDSDNIHTMLGYVPRKFSSEVCAKFEAGRELSCIITELNAEAKPWNRCEVEIRQLED